MAKTHESPYHGHHRLRVLIELALSESWIVCSLDDGGLKLVKPGLPPIFIGAAAPDLSASRGAQGDRHD